MYLWITAPVGVWSLAQILLIKCMRGQNLNCGHDGGGLGFVWDAVQVKSFRVFLQIVPFLGPHLGNEFACHGWMIGHEPRILILPKVHCRMVTWGHPCDSCECLSEIFHRIQDGPTFRILLVAMANRPKLSPPALKLSIILHCGVVFVEQLQVICHVCLQCCPYLKPVHCVWVILNDQLQPMWSICVWHRHSPVQTTTGDIHQYSRFDKKNSEVLLSSSEFLFYIHTRTWRYFIILGDMVTFTILLNGNTIFLPLTKPISSIFANIRRILSKFSDCFLGSPPESFDIYDMGFFLLSISTSKLTYSIRDDMDKGDLFQLVEALVSSGESFILIRLWSHSYSCWMATLSSYPLAEPLLSN